MTEPGPAAGRFPLAALPTPLTRAPRLGRALGLPELWVKRDDLTGFMLAGNKARQLERLVADALAGGADTLVTGGGAGSNYCAGAAAAARVAGLRCVLVLYGEPAQPHPNLALARWHGAEVRYTGAADRASVDPALDRVAAEVRAGGGRPYVAPRGGASPAGTLAYLDAGRELAGQLAAAGVVPATVVVAAGSGGTAAGLVASAVADRNRWRVVAAAVSRPPVETADRMLRLAEQVAAGLGLRPATAADIEVRDARGPGYGLPSEQGERAAEIAASTEGLLLDPVFSAKALGILLDRPALPGPIVFWHTGGQAAALAQLLAGTGAAVPA